MDFNNEKNIEEILKAYGYYKDEGLTEKRCSYFNSDMKDGFQDVNPLIFVTVGEVIANLISGTLPFNVANTVSNLIILIGQIIETYGTQQLYYENGPGRTYASQNRNIDNKNCQESDISEVKAELNILKEEFDKVTKIVNKLENRVNNLDNNQ